MSVPEPPPDLASRSLPLTILAAGEFIYRIHMTKDGPKYFRNSALYRFDCPDGSYGVLYSGLNPEVAFAETLLRGGNFVALSEIDKRSLCKFRVVRDLRLLQLFGPGMVVIGANAGVTSGPDYPVAWRWSKALHDHPEGIDGIMYRATHDNNEHAVALFERARTAIDDGTSVEFSTDRSTVARILDHYGASTR